jgi:type VI secretion system ImpA family protein
MSSTEAILIPIQGADPAGRDLRYDPVYDRIKEMRREDDPRASRGIWLTKLKVADWSGAAELCAEVLEARSKDLQLACWLVDAIVARDGLHCLPPGLRLIGEFCDAFWPVLWPRPAQDDEEDPRQVVFSWLDSRISERAMLTRIAIHNDIEASWQDLVYAQRAASATERKSTRRGAADVSELDTASIESAIEHTGDAYYAELARDVAAGMAALARLKALLDRLCDGRGPSFSRSLAALTAIATFLRPQLLRRGIAPGGIAPGGIAPGEIAPGEIAPGGTAPGEIAPGAIAPGGIARGEMDGPHPETDECKIMTEISMNDAVPWQADAAAPIRTRDEAYRMLDAAARFLERTEPHSPVSLLIRRAIVWGRMPLPALLGEMMRDQALTYRLLGIEEDGPAPARGGK